METQSLEVRVIARMPREYGTASPAWHCLPPSPSHTGGEAPVEFNPSYPGLPSCTPWNLILNGVALLKVLSWALSF